MTTPATSATKQEPPADPPNSTQPPSDKSPNPSSESTIHLKPVSELLVDEEGKSARYWIPAYQRGYRWSPSEVRQLLDDVWEFERESRGGGKDEFYCLQPLVIRKHADGRFEVVDGQQRLTTLLLILNHLNQRFSDDFRKPLYAISFETRPTFAALLEAPSKELAESNVDFFHLYEAIQEIRLWFKDRVHHINDIESALLNRTKVIWFQLAEGDKPVDAFTRLNVGKIPLSNDELIRALFLKQRRSPANMTDDAKLRIAYEWDLIEKALQTDAFWCFLSNERGKTQNRIGFIFELSAKMDGLPQEKARDYGIFFAFNTRLNAEGADPESEWLRLKQIYMTFEEWFEDRSLYHVIGFLVNEGESLEELLRLSADCAKRGFEQKLKSRIFKRTIGGDLPKKQSEEEIRKSVSDVLETLDYEIKADRPKIKSVLLLFNLATLLQDSRSNIRFQFDSFKGGKWDIEHVRSVTSDRPTKHSLRRAWLDQCLQCLTADEDTDELQKKIIDFNALDASVDLDEHFDELYELLLTHFKETAGNEADHGIGNLTLLDEHTNRSYKNAVFAAKRHRLLSLDRAGIFVPLCTRNVFLKCYSPKAGNAIFWTEADRASYQSEIVDTLTRFFAGSNQTSP